MNKVFIKKLKNIIYKYIDRLNKINIYNYLQIIIWVINHLTYFKNYTVDY